MTLTYRNVKSSKHVSFNVIDAHALTELNYISHFGSQKSKVVSLTFTIFTVRHLRSWIYGFSFHYLVVDCKMKNLLLQKNFIYAIFFLCRVII